MPFGLGGGGVHAEELPFSFTMGWGWRERGGEEEEDGREEDEGGNREVGRLQYPD